MEKYCLKVINHHRYLLNCKLLDTGQVNMRNDCENPMKVSTMMDTKFTSFVMVLSSNVHVKLPYIFMWVLGVNVTIYIEVMQMVVKF